MSALARSLSVSANQLQDSGVAPPRFELARQHSKSSWIAQKAKGGDNWRIIKLPLTYDRATNAQFQLDKHKGATGKSLIVLNLWLTVN
jgi:hypothetical protein